MSRRHVATLLMCSIAVAAISAQHGGSDDPPLRTRSESVAPSPRNASYDIDVRLDHDTRTLRGRETISWTNISAIPASELQLHLYWNAWRNERSTWLRERHLGRTYTPPPDGWGSIDITSIKAHGASGPADLTSRMRFIAPDDGNADDRTVMTIPMEPAVPPGAGVQLDVEWTAKVPKPFARTGYIGDYYFIAQWFPKVGVLQDTGWNTHQFHTATEFFADFGLYDVRITLPSRFVVGASGRQTERKENGDGTTTHRYQGEDIHDFAWTASPDALDLSRTFTHQTLPPIDVRLLLRPEHRSQADRYFAVVSATLRRYGEWFGAYPYGHVTVVDPAFQSQSDGMEYPTFLTGRARWLTRANVQTPEMTTAHEVGHQWWYGIVASNEFEDAWMDEGINTYATARVIDEAFNPNRVEIRYFGAFLPWAFDDVPFTRIDNDRITGYRDNAEADVQATPTFRYWPVSASMITYNKTALWMHTLERTLGWPVMQRILSTYFERWKFKHPKPADFFAVVNEVSGQDLTWFFDQVYRGSNTFDYGVQELTSERTDDGTYRTVVVVRRFGEATFPVDVQTRFADGRRITERWNGLDRRATFVYERAARAHTVHVDPNRVLLLDTTYTNNTQTLAPRTREASVKWAAKWMVWLQDTLLTYAFFL